MRILGEFRHTDSNCRLVIQETDGGFAVGWTGGAKNSSIVAPLSFNDLNQAFAMFDIYRTIGPTTAALRRDWQRKRLYDWERAYIGCTDVIAKEKIIDAMPEMLTFAESSVDQPLVMPVINFGIRDSTSFYYTANNSINLTTVGQRLDVLIHELSHAWEVMSARGPGHGPAFVGLLISMYARFLDKREGALRRSAADSGLVFV